MKLLCKKAFSFLAASCIVSGIISKLPVFAVVYTEKTVGDFTVHEYSTYVEIAKFNNKEITSVTIPSEIDGLPVISIKGGANAYTSDAPFGQSQIESISLPDCLISIGQYAFSRSSLKSIEIPDSVKNIGSNAFSECVKLEAAKLSKQMQEIPARSFSGCTALKEVTLPDSLTKIGYDAFRGAALESLQFPDSLREIEYGAFCSCKKLQSVHFPAKMQGISTVYPTFDGAFQDCIALKEVHIPATATVYGNAFKGCAGMEKLTIDEGAKHSFGRFDGCKSLKKVEIPKSFNTCPTFDNCTALTSVSFADNISTTGSFQNCISLEEINLPESVKNFGEYGQTASFQNCAKLKRIVINNPSCRIFDSRASICNYTLNGTSYFDGIIYGTEGSTAQAYAEKYGYQFALIGSDKAEILLGDVNNDGEISVEDAQLTLIEYVSTMSGLDGSFTEKQKLAGNVNGDQQISVEDAQIILIYYVKNTLAGENFSWEQILHPQDDTVQTTTTSSDSNIIIDSNGARNHKLTFEALQNVDKENYFASTVFTDQKDYIPDIKAYQAYWLDVSQKKDYVFDGDLLEFEVTVNKNIPNGIYPFGVYFADLSNYSANTDKNAAYLNNVKYQTGYICVNKDKPTTQVPESNMSLSMDSVSAKPGETVRMRLCIKNNPGLVAFVIRMYYDNNAITITRCGAGSDLNKLAILTTYLIGE